MQRNTIRLARIEIAALLAATVGLCAAACAAQNLGSKYTNSLGMVFRRVEPGSFTMGVGHDPKLSDHDGVGYDQQPAHRVTLTQPFYVLSGKVTQADYQRSGLPGSADDISWDHAAAFCRWLSHREGRTYRLPTEAQWDYARHHSHGGGDWSGREWVRDWFGDYPADNVMNPVGPVTGLTKVIRDRAQRDSLPPDASSSPWELPKTGFRVVLAVDSPTNQFVQPPPFNQAAVLQSAAPAKQGPNPNIPYFTVQFALPIPPDDATNLDGPLTGLDQAVMAHNHSPGFEILPNGDALAIYFSAKDHRGSSESGPDTRFVQARLRYGSVEWDPPELFCDFKPMNDQSGLLWQDGHTLRFFGGGRGSSPWMPFKMATSTNNGATWTMSLPYLDAPAQNYTPQPIVNAFRGAGGGMYFAMDGHGSRSFLWRSLDGGIHWHQMAGRTGGRHSTIVPLDSRGDLLSIGGKNHSINGWSPENTSSNWGASWSPNKKSPFPALGSNQRPCLIRLANGHLCFVSDTYNRKTGKSPEGWKYGHGCIVAISKDNGRTWHIKRLPITLPHERDRKYGTLGYATVRQGPNGVIHLLTTMTYPCLQYEFNEAWVFSKAGAIPPEDSGGVVRNYTEHYPDGALRARWSARICPNGRYLLDGRKTTYYENGRKEYEGSFINGRKTGGETYWAPDGRKIWSWTHDPKHNTATWIHYWSNGLKRVESHWDTKPLARDLDRHFYGLVANGPAYLWKQDGSPDQAYEFKDGHLAGTLPLPKPQAKETHADE